MKAEGVRTVLSPFLFLTASFWAIRGVQSQVAAQATANFAFET
jgi:hypothetical protein